MTDSISAKMCLRVLRFLDGVKSVQLSDFGDKNERRVLLSGADNLKILCQREVIEALHKASLIDFSGQTCRLLPAGKKRLKRADAVRMGDKDGGFAAQHRDEVKTTLKRNNYDEAVMVNRNESPLSRLKSRKMADGRPWISDAAFEAGERLRRDFSRSQLMPNVTMNWSDTRGGRQPWQRNDKADLLDGATDARVRMESALECVGPELAGLVTDVCCFLKGLETVERERRWPPRSAKLMLRTALDLLARHYGTIAGMR